MSTPLSVAEAHRRLDRHDFTPVRQYLAVREGVPPAELDGMDPDDPGFPPRLDRLRIEVLSHARAEERYEFEKLRGKFSEAQHRALAAAVRAAEATAPTHPHPGTESAKKNFLIGPPMAIIDRTRDLIRKALG